MVRPCHEIRKIYLIQVLSSKLGKNIKTSSEAALVLQAEWYFIINDPKERGKRIKFCEISPGFRDIAAVCAQMFPPKTHNSLLRQPIKNFT